MKKTTAVLAVSFVLGALCARTAGAQVLAPDTYLTIGAKVWHADWQSYVPSTYGGVGPTGARVVGDSVNEVEAKAKTEAFPFFSVRHKNVFVSFSHAHFANDFYVATSPVLLPGGQTLITSRNEHLQRRESDLNLGYFVTPEVALVLGYKDALESRDTVLGAAASTPLARTSAHVLLFGSAGSFPVAGALRFYTQAAYGPGRLSITFADPALGSFSPAGRYLIGEIGLTYPVCRKADGTSNATVSLGYRTQSVRTDGSAGLFQSGARTLRDVRDGAILSVNVTI